MNILDAKNFLKLSIPNISESDINRILMHILKIDKNSLILNKNIGLSRYDKEVFLDIIERLKSHEPLQYILGIWEFMGLEFELCNHVLIPRFETELLVDFILKKETGDGLEIGVGTGCISISLAKIGNINMTGVDISEYAIKLSKKNAKKLDICSKTNFILSDIFPRKYSKFDFIVSNPPYISKLDMQNLPKSVLFEPKLALYGGKDGLDFYRKITKDASKFLNPKGRIYYEIGYNQAIDIKKILIQNGFINIHIIKDFAGFDRIVYAELESN